MKKRIMSLILTVLMMMSLLSAFSANVFAAGSIEFAYKPTVYMGGGGEYNIVWKTNVNSIGYVTFKTGGKTYTVYDEENGVVRSDDRFHTVRVSQSLFDAAGSYIVYSTAVNSRKDYDLDLGVMISTSSAFTGYHNQNEIKFGFFSDIHLNQSPTSILNECKTRMNNEMGGVDVIVLNGDIVEPRVESDFDKILLTGNTISDGKLPVLFVKGNHECRGEYSQYMGKYLSFNTGEFYGAWDYGPISGISIDIGEDKEDDHREYAGVNDMDHFFDEQEIWLENMGGYTEGSQYYISVCHSPTYIDRYKTQEYAQIMKEYGTDLLVCGHSHDLTYIPSSKKIAGLPVMHDGGHRENNTKMATSMVTFANGTYTMKGFSETGGTVFTEKLEPKRKGSSAMSTVKHELAVDNSVDQENTTATAQTEDTSEFIPTTAGVSTMEIKGAANTAVKITAKPVVFDCGLYYSVVWQTDLISAGYVVITGETPTDSKTYMDSTAGKLRTDTIHSVKIPKTQLDGKNYFVQNRVVTNYGAYGLAQNPPTSYGPYVNGLNTKFLGDSEKKQTKYSVVAVGNIPVSTATDVLNAKNVKSSFTGNPNLIVSMGNMVGSLNTASDFGNYLQFMNEVSSGSVPVLFLRGENETKGSFAAYLNRYLRITTENLVKGKLYNNTTYGDLAAISLDTATTDKDSAAKYKNLASFDLLRQEQADWIKNTIPNSFKAKYNLVFANGDGISNYAGVDFTEGLYRVGTNLVVTAGSGKASFQDRGKSYAVATCGSIAGDNTFALMLICQNSKITVKTLGASAKEIGDVNTTISSASNDEPKKPVDDDDDDITNPTPTTPTETDKPTDNKGGTKKPTVPAKNNGGTTGGTPTEGSVSYEDAEFEGLDADMYIRTVAEGWYNKYLSLGFKFTSVTNVVTDGKITEGVFIEVISNLVGINHSIYSDETTKADKASAWAEAYSVYSGYLGGDTVLSDTVISSVLSGLFVA